MQQITVQELQKKLINNSDIHLLDVREPDENAEFNIGGTLLPLGQITSFQTDVIDDWKEETVYVYCRSGKRSMQACMFLEQAGFKNIINVEGGILAWQAMNS
jgi:rhodanese-related sulfurtransferase